MTRVGLAAAGPTVYPEGMRTPPGALRGLLASAAAFLIGLAGCGSTSPSTSAQEEATVLLMDARLSDWVRIGSQQGKRDPDTGAFLAETVLVNRSLQMLRLEARTLFKDAAGATVEASAWRVLYLDPAAQATHRAPCIHPDAVKFLTQIRPAPADRPGMSGAAPGPAPAAPEPGRP